MEAIRKKDEHESRYRLHVMRENEQRQIILTGKDGRIVWRFVLIDIRFGGMNHTYWKGWRGMELTHELGYEIINRLAAYTEVNLNIMNLNGKIVASTDQTRIGQIHSGAKRVIQSMQPVILYRHDVKNNSGMKPGVNLPIIHKGKIKGVVGVSGNPEKIRHIAGMVRATTELVLEQIYIQRQISFKERQWAHWIQQLLHPLGFHQEQLESDAIYSLQINPKQSWRVLVFTGQSIQDDLELIRTEITERKINVLFVLPFRDDEIITAIPATYHRVEHLTERVLKLCTKQIWIGVGNVEYHIKGIRTSYYQAKQALQFANRKRSISYIKDWDVERLIDAISQSEYDSVCKNYQSLLESMGEEYIHTLSIYFTCNFSIKDTAQHLHIHRNTLLYRLEQLEKKVGLNPKRFADAFLYRIILHRLP